MVGAWKTYAHTSSYNIVSVDVPVLYLVHVLVEKHNFLFWDVSELAVAEHLVEVQTLT